MSIDMADIYDILNAFRIPVARPPVISMQVYVVAKPRRGNTLATESEWRKDSMHIYIH